jgi:transposase
MEDECHLLWGDTLGYVWAKRNCKATIPVLNERERQTYYGAVNCYTGEFHILPYSAGNGENTVDYVKKIMQIYENKKIMIIWDGASYHRFSAFRDYLSQVNQGLPTEDWRITCELFAPNAPEQNPVEDIWLQGKNFLRKNFAVYKTFSQVKKAFLSFLQNRKFNFSKIQMYRNFITHSI